MRELIIGLIAGLLLGGIIGVLVGKSDMIRTTQPEKSTPNLNIDLDGKKLNLDLNNS